MTNDRRPGACLGANITHQAMPAVARGNIMFRKALIGLAMVAGACLIWTAGYSFGKHLAMQGHAQESVELRRG